MATATEHKTNHMGIPTTTSLFSLVFDPDNDEILNDINSNKYDIKQSVSNASLSKPVKPIKILNDVKLCGMCNKTPAEKGWPYCDECYTTCRGKKCRTKSCNELTRLKSNPVGIFAKFCDKCRSKYKLQK
jgi:hypothetical protein